MHAVVVKVTVGDPETAASRLREEVVPRIAQLPGFVAGYWTRPPGAHDGLSMIVFESEGQARTAADRVRDTAPPDVTVDSVEVREVVANA